MDRYTENFVVCALCLLLVRDGHAVDAIFVIGIALAISCFQTWRDRRKQRVQ